MEEVILQQIESLELIMTSQQRRLDIAERKLYIATNHLKELAKIESNFITFGSLSNEEQLDKQLILSQYL
jgi:hypothetical protein